MCKGLKVWCKLQKGGSISVYKGKHFIDIEKEEVWLREMSVQGWLFTRRTSFGYHFEPSQEGEQIFRIDYRTFKKYNDFVDYLYLFDDAGWRHVAGTKNSGYQYFVAKSDNPETEIFSDDATRAARYRYLATGWATFFVICLALVVMLVLQGNFNPEVFADPKALYYTPGLWEMEGIVFLAKFLFETPFVILRNFVWIFTLPILLVSIYYLVRTLLLSRRH